MREIIMAIKHARWRWVGHTARRNGNRGTMNWQPKDGEKGRGRQKRRWGDDIRV